MEVARDPLGIGLATTTRRPYGISAEVKAMPKRRAALSAVFCRRSVIGRTACLAFSRTVVGAFFGVPLWNGGSGAYCIRN
jgi:hypothetical protein